MPPGLLLPEGKMEKHRVYTLFEAKTLKTALLGGVGDRVISENPVGKKGRVNRFFRRRTGIYCLFAADLRVA